MKIEELDKIIEKYKDVNHEAYIQNEVDKTIDKILENEHYYILRKLDIYVLIPFFTGLTCVFIQFFVNTQINPFLRILIPLNLLLSVFTIFLLIWNVFRIPIRIKLIKKILYDTTSDYWQTHKDLFRKISLPYLELFFKYNLLLNKNFNTTDNSKEIKQKFLEIEDSLKPLVDKYFKLLIYYKDLNEFRQPLKTDKFPRIQFIIDRFADIFRYYTVSLSFLSLIIFLIYTYIINFW